MPPDNFLRTPCFLKWVGWRYDQTAEIGKIQGSQEKKRMLFLLPPPASKALLFAAGHCPERERRPLKAGSDASVSFPGVILWFIIRNVYSFSFLTVLLKSFTNHLTNIYVTNISGTLTSDWEMKPKVCSQHWEWTWVTSSIYVVK